MRVKQRNTLKRERGKNWRTMGRHAQQEADLDDAQEQVEEFQEILQRRQNLYRRLADK